MKKQGYDIKDRPVYEISFLHDGNRNIETVGNKSMINNEIVVAIFESNNLFLVCTYNRGVARGEPIKAGKGFNTSIKYFNDVAPF